MTSEIIKIYSGKEFNNNQGFFEIEDNVNQESWITKVSLLSDGGTVKSHFDLTETINIDIEYIVRENLPELQLTVIVSKDGISLFQAFDNDNVDEIEVTGIGRYRSRYTIPKMMLKEGVYTVAVLQGLPHKLIQEVKEELVFEIENNYINLLRKSYRADRIGNMVSPGRWRRELICE
jgi:lipopolysaccharide transport system ATP-binding protein